MRVMGSTEVHVIIIIRARLNGKSRFYEVSNQHVQYTFLEYKYKYIYFQRQILWILLFGCRRTKQNPSHRGSLVQASWKTHPRNIDKRQSTVHSRPPLNSKTITTTTESRRRVVNNGVCVTVTGTNPRRRVTGTVCVSASSAPVRLLLLLLLRQLPRRLRSHGEGEMHVLLSPVAFGLQEGDLRVEGCPLSRVDVVHSPHSSVQFNLNSTAFVSSRNQHLGACLLEHSSTCITGGFKTVQLPY